MNLLIIVKGLGSVTKNTKNTQFLIITNIMRDLGKVKETSGVDKNSSTILRAI